MKGPKLTKLSFIFMPGHADVKKKKNELADKFANVTVLRIQRAMDRVDILNVL